MKDVMMFYLESCGYCDKARRALDWEGMKQAALDPAMVDKRRVQHHNEEVCAMCGKFCAVKMLKEAKIV